MTFRQMLSRPPYWALLTMSLIIIVGVGIWYGASRFFSSEPSDVPPQLSPDPPPPDPRLTFPTPFRNVKPDIGYVGDVTCSGCHPDITRSYHAHPMGRSAEIAVRAESIEDFEQGNPFRAGPYEMRVEKTANGIQHRVSVPSTSAVPDHVISADVTIGSGTRGRSYLTIESGSVWQSPISWATRDGHWVLSPGFDPGMLIRRPIESGCLFCHVDRVDPVPGTVNRYHEPLLRGQPAIGCERCHGPGELHASERAAGLVPEGIDTSIVNPKYLEADLRLSICQQCHLQGKVRVNRRARDPFEFRPGLPWELFVAVFVDHPDVADHHRSVSQFEQMAVSKCFTQSGGKMDCTTCHDPHMKPHPNLADSFYRNRCLTCHKSQACSLPPPERQSRNDNCVACHMPKSDSSNIVHAAVTDHRVLRRPQPASPRTSPAPPDAVPLAPFLPGPNAPPEAERERDLGVALTRIYPPELDGVREYRSAIARLAEPRLLESLKIWPGDAVAWTALGAARYARGDVGGSLEACRAAVKLDAKSESALAALAFAATQAGDFDTALRAADELIRMNPSSTEHRLTRAAANLLQKEWARVEGDCRAALEIYPLLAEARLLTAVARHHQGDRVAARREFEAALRLSHNPRQKAVYEGFYRQHTR
jgi:predicted CXXCH cytochrome family protein